MGSALLGAILAISVYMKGDLADNKTYHVYDCTINLNGEIDHPAQTRNDAFWLIFQQTPNPSGSSLLGVEDLDSFVNSSSKTTLDDAKYRLEDIYVDFHQYAQGITWLEWGWTHYWLNNPSYSLKVGPEGSSVQVSGDMAKDFPGAPRQARWIKGNNYTVRIVSSLTSGFGQQDDTGNDDRNIIYKGLPSLIDQSDWDKQQLRIGNTLTIKVAPADPDDYSLVNCKSSIENYKSTYISPDGSKTKAPDKALEGGLGQDGAYYTAHLLLNSDVYHVGDTFGIVTECEFQPKPGALGIGGQKKAIKHSIKIEKDNVNVITNLIEVFRYRPVPINLHGYFLEDNQKVVRVHGTVAGIDAGVSLDEIKIDASLDSKQTWQSPVGKIQWDGMNFSCDFQADIPSDRAISIDVRASIEGAIGAFTQVAHAPFDLASFVEAHFINPTTRTPIYGDGGVVSINTQSLREDPTSPIRKVGNKIEIELSAVVAISHAIDNLGFHLALPDSIQKLPGQNWAPNWKPQSAIWSPNNDWDGGASGDSSLLIKGAGGALQPTDYWFNVRVLLNKQDYRSGEKITLTIDASQSKAVKLEDPDAVKPMIRKTLSFGLF